MCQLRSEGITDFVRPAHLKCPCAGGSYIEKFLSFEPLLLLTPDNLCRFST